MVTRYLGAQAADHHSATSTSGYRERSNPLMAAGESNSATLNALRRLTPQQRDVLNLMTQGKSNTGICRILNLAKPTVKNHVAAILQTLNVTNRAEAVIKASRASALPVSNSSTPHTFLGYIPGAL
jgi:DNA-binding NarL/FixJ family response regulator